MKSCIITYDELENTGNVAGFLQDAIQRHWQSEMYRVARSADKYFKQRNETIASFTARLFDVDGGEFVNETASKLKMANNFFRRLNVQRCMYSLGKGVSFVNVDEDGTDTTKAKLGATFDDDVKKIGMLALIHGVAFPFWNFDHINVFDATEFAPIWDETTGALRAGIRFWRLDRYHNWHAVLYTEDGYCSFVASTDGGLDFVQSEQGLKPYKITYQETPADGLKMAVDEQNYSRLPIVPIWGNDNHQSTLIGLRESLDAYDLIKSGLANDVQDCAQIYWLVENAGGMNDADLQEFRDRLKLTHIANVDNADEVSITPYTQEPPTGARTATLAQIKADMYEDFGALDVHTIAAGATNDHIDAAYQPMDEEADEFERHIREGIIDLLALQGIEDTPVFTRNRVSNQKEQVEIVLAEAQYLDDETILRKLPNITPDEVREILKRKDAEAADIMNAPVYVEQSIAGDDKTDAGEKQGENTEDNEGAENATEGAQGAV